MIESFAYIVVVKLVGSLVGLLAKIVETVVAHHRTPLHFEGVISETTVRVHGHNFFLWILLSGGTRHWVVQISTHRSRHNLIWELLHEAFVLESGRVRHCIQFLYAGWGRFRERSYTFRRKSTSAALIRVVFLHIRPRSLFKNFRWSFRLSFCNDPNKIIRLLIQCRASFCPFLKLLSCKILPLRQAL